MSHQATFALITTWRRRSLAVCWFRQRMWRRIKLPWALWEGWSVPSRAKKRKAVTWASMRLSQELLVGVWV